jgi:hypothetical protein
VGHYFLVSFRGCVVTFIQRITVQRITDVIEEYQTKVCQLPFLPKASFHRDSMGHPGDVNKFFLAFLFSCNFARVRPLIHFASGSYAISTSPPTTPHSSHSSVSLIRDLVFLIRSHLTVIRDPCCPRRRLYWPTILDCSRLSLIRVHLPY